MNQTIEEIKNSDRSFPEDYHLENGNYIVPCISCGEYFAGYKRRVVCKRCQTNDSTIKTQFVKEQIEQIFKDAGM